MEKEEQIKMFAKSLKHQVGLALSENQCYQFTKIVWNTAERETKDVKPQSDSNSTPKCKYLVRYCQLDEDCKCKKQ